MKCSEPECRKQFSVAVGTVFERSKIGLLKWLAAAKWNRFSAFDIFGGFGTGHRLTLEMKVFHKQ